MSRDNELPLGEPKEDDTVAGTVEVVTETPETKAVSTKAAAPMPAMAQAVMPGMMSSQELITFALVNDKLDTLDKLIAMKNAEEDRANKREFTLHFSEMQREFPPVYRDGQVKGKDGTHKYNYISLDAILKVYSPIIAKHGFGFRWTEEEVKDGKEKRVWCIVSGYGHEERTYVDIPVLSATDFTNAIQQRGSATSYGKRYSFMNLFGVIVADEDDDAAGFEDGVKLGHFIQLIREATTQAERKAAVMSAVNSPDLTDREKAIVSAESRARQKEMWDRGIKE